MTFTGKETVFMQKFFPSLADKFVRKFYFKDGRLIKWFWVYFSEFRINSDSIILFMATVTKFEELEIWQKARELAQDIFAAYPNSDSFYKDYKLKEQINRASGSIMDNIAEGFERNGRNEFIQFLSIAKGSAGEVKSQLYRALDRRYISKELFDKLYNRAEELGKKIGGFINYLKKSEFGGTKYKKEIVPNKS